MYEALFEIPLHFYITYNALMSNLNQELMYIIFYLDNANMVKGMWIKMEQDFNKMIGLLQDVVNKIPKVYKKQD